MQISISFASNKTENNVNVTYFLLNGGNHVF